MPDCLGIVGILLAAGRATRFGGGKLLAPLEAGVADRAGTPIGVAAAMHLVAALPHSIAVVRAHDVELSRQLRNVGLRVVPCEQADEGIGASLACGVRAAANQHGYVVALADMPWIQVATIVKVASALADGADIAAPAYKGVRGHPVGFSRRHAAALAALTGDAGARSVVQSSAASLVVVDVDDRGILLDIDRPQDLSMAPNDHDASAV